MTPHYFEAHPIPMPYSSKILHQSEGEDRSSRGEIEVLSEERHEELLQNACRI